MTPEAAAFEQQVAPLMAELLASANALDAGRHCAIYAHDPALLVTVNGEHIRGWDAYSARQREWWSGRAEGGYEYRGQPVYQALGENVGLTTVVILSRSLTPEGQFRDREIDFTALWNLRPEGWRITYAHESPRS